MNGKPAHPRGESGRPRFKTLIAGAALCAAAAAVPAHAGAITFEGYTGLVGHGDYLLDGGFVVAGYSNAVGAAAGDLVGALVDGSDSGTCISAACPVNNPSTYYSALDDGYIDIAPANGGTFHIGSFDASFLGSYGTTSYPAIAGLLRIQGVLANGSSAIETYQLVGPGANGFNFQHFNASSAFSQLEFVEAVFFGYTCNSAGGCSAFSTDRGQFGIDNITMVPEPSSELMVGLGLAALCVVARRRKA